MSVRMPRARLRARHSLCAARRRVVARLLFVALIVVLGLSVPSAVVADSGEPVVLAVKTLPQVIDSLRLWIVGILAAVATLYLVLAGVYLTIAGGDTAQVERGKAALRTALVGYGLALLAPVLLQIVKGIVGG